MEVFSFHSPELTPCNMAGGLFFLCTCHDANLLSRYVQIIAHVKFLACLSVTLHLEKIPVKWMFNHVLWCLCEVAGFITVWLGFYETGKER